MSSINLELKRLAIKSIHSGFSSSGASEILTSDSPSSSRSILISLGIASDRSMLDIDISNMFAMLFDILSSGAVILRTASRMNSISNSRFTYVVTFIAEIAEYENAGGCISIKSVGRYPFLSVRNAIWSQALHSGTNGDPFRIHIAFVISFIILRIASTLPKSFGIFGGGGRSGSSIVGSVGRSGSSGISKLGS